jgi:peptidoglycan hydrolase-like protein with peptidoglycan-binding domain
MTNKNKLKAALASLLGAALVFTVTGTAFAQTNTGTSTSGTSGSGTIFTLTSEQILLLNSSNLHLGSTGEQVRVLQGLLAEFGFLDLTTTGGPTGYFGPLTRNALARYQAAIGVPSTGNFGPMTRGSMAMHFVRNNWLNNLAGITVNGVIGVANNSNAGPNTGGADLPMFGEFGATNPGFYWNGVWYPNIVNLSNSNSGSTNTSGNSSVNTNNGNSGTSY